MADPRTTAAKLTAKLRDTFRDDLRTVLLFGSVPRGEATPGVSDLNTLVLLDSVSTAMLARVAPIVQDWIRQGNTPPHIYSVDEWSGMRDTFAMEIADMQDARDVLWGTDPVSLNAVQFSDLRLHAERETRQTLLQLRLRLTLAIDNPIDVGALLLAGLPSFSAYMRAALRLGGQEPGLDTRPVIERAAALIGSDPKPMMTCWNTRRSLRNLEVALTDPLVEQYLGFVKDLMRYLDEVRASVPERRGATAAPRSSGPTSQ
jgi:predicted nucleotidyltransferase